MMQKAIAFLALFLVLATSALAHPHCSTAEVFQNIHKHNRVKAFQVSKEARTISPNCETEDYYDSVYTKKTPHFQIFYTLDGPHQTTNAYVDTLADALENAWDFHIKKTGFLKPLGDTISYHYQQHVDKGLYPVEVVEMTLFRDIAYILKRRCLDGCYAITLTSETEPITSTLMIENDFMYPNEFSQSRDSVTFNGKSCYYNTPVLEIRNRPHNYSYAQKWNNALRVTATHELYHAVQMRYLSPNASTYWFEASAAGVEEVLNPDIDDYIQYLPDIAPRVGTPINELDDDYSLSILYLYLYNLVSKKFDKSIWESFSKNQQQPFEYQFIQAAKKHSLSADSLFHEFAVRLSFSGKRAKLANESFLINKDQSSWPEFGHISTSLLTTPPETSNYAYNFYTGDKPDLSNFVGRASVATIKGDSYSIRYLPTLNSVDSAFTDIRNGTGIDSTVWILSRFSEETKLPYEVKDSTLRAYPTPWRHGSLCFTPLPGNKDFIEIRNRRGNLVTKIKYDNNTRCIDESEVKSLLVPGVYRFRAGNSGKLKDFIIVY